MPSKFNNTSLAIFTFSDVLSGSFAIAVVFLRENLIHWNNWHSFHVSAFPRSFLVSDYTDVS